MAVRARLRVPRVDDEYHPYELQLPQRGND